MSALSNRLAGKVALVTGTGTGSGIAKGCALMFARHGARVMGCDVHAESAEATLTEAVQEQLPFESTHPCDLSDPLQVESLVNRTVERFGGIDILVNAAAFAAFAWIDVSQWKATLVGELDVVFLAC